MNSILWYDYETSGTDPRQDRVLQFGALRTDEALQAIGEPVMFHVRPANDCLPSPDACLVTGITPQKALAEGLVEAEAMDRIQAEFLRPGTCGAGYNSLRFDDEFTRNGLYRNYFDPYEREWRNGNSRWDLLNVLRAAWLLRPQGIEWPLNDKGLPGFRLEDLTAANDISHEGAHDALADVHATIAMARLLRSAQPRFYEWMYGLRRKQAVQDFLRSQQGRPLLHVSSMFPAEYGKASLVWPVATHPKNRNSLIVFDLRADPVPLADLSVEQIAHRVFTRQEHLAAGETRLPLKEVHLNRCPVLLHGAAVDEQTAGRMQIDIAKCEQHAAWLREAGDLQQRIAPVFERSFEVVDDPDARLYDGFIPDHDRDLLPEFRAASLQQRCLQNWPFRDERLRALMLRYRARNWPELLTSEERAQWQAHRVQRLGGDSPTGIAACLSRISELRAEPRSRRDLEVLDALEQYALQLRAELIP